MQINIHEVFPADASFHMPVTAIYAFMDYTPKHTNHNIFKYNSDLLHNSHIDINDSKVIKEL